MTWLRNGNSFLHCRPNMACFDGFLRGARGCVVALLLPFTVASLPGANSPLVGAYVPNPGIVSYARAQGISLDRLQVMRETAAAVPGDRVTVLITLREKQRVSQWLSRFEVSALTVAEQQKAQPRYTTFKSYAGREHSFSATPSLALDIRTVGPLADGDRTTSEEKQARTIVSPDFLSVGFDRAADAILFMKEKPKGTPVPEEHERAVIGSFPAFLGLFEAVQNTPGLRDILFKVLEKPSVWSFVKARGFKLNLDINDASVPAAPDDTFADAPVRTLNVNIVMNEKPALNCVFYVTSPRPPLLATAGVFRIVATSPKREDVHLEVRVVAAEMGARGE